MKGKTMEEKYTLPAAIDEIIARFPDGIQEKLLQIRQVIRETAPEAVEQISYNMPAFFLNGGLVWYCAYKKHIGFYPRSAGMDQAVRGLNAYKGTKGSVHFPLDQPIPYDLIREMVKYRVAENQKGTPQPAIKN